MSNIVRQYEQFPTAFKVLGALVIIGGTAYTAWEEFIVPKLSVLEEKRASQTKIEQELQQLNRDFVSTVSLEEELAIANREFKRLIELLPQDASVDRVLNDFASLARLTGTEIREFSPSAELSALSTITTPGTQMVPPPMPQSIPNPNDANKNNQSKAVIELEDTNAIGLQTKMLGTFPAIISFLDLAMSLPRVVRIQDFEIVNTDKDLKLTQKPTLTFNGLFYAYFQKGDAQRTTLSFDSAPSDKSKSPTANIGKPAFDLNKMIDQSYSAKPLNGGAK